MNEPKISVIVPVYNAERWLRRCIDSILAQTYSDFELLLIDDGSTDGSGAICDEYAALDARIRPFHKSNGGVSSARNLGLDNALGEWICFIDSDDWMCKAHLEDLIKYPQYDFRANEYRCNNGEFSHESLIDNNYLTVTDVGGCIASFFNEHFRMPWGKRYCSKIIKKYNIFFNTDITIGEDLLFNLEYLKHIDSISTSSYVGIIYFRNNETSLTHQRERYTPELFLTEMCTSLKILGNKYNRDFKKLFFDLSLYDFNVGLEQIIKSEKPLRIKSQQLKNFMLIEACDIIINNNDIPKWARRKAIDFLLKNKFYMIAVKFLEYYTEY